MTLKHDHSPEAIAERLSEGPKQSYLRDWIYGGIDGAVTTFAIVSGVVGAELATKTILILGVANLLADGFSMAASNYLGTRTEREEKERIEAYETRQVHLQPEGEREEVRQILKMKGFSGELLEKAVSRLTANKQEWVRFMLTEEYGISSSNRSAPRAGMATFSSFVICGAVPLIPFLVKAPSPFFWACLLTGGVFFLIGSLKSRWSLISWWRSGLETFAIGASAATLAYAVGVLLKGLG